MTPVGSNYLAGPQNNDGSCGIVTDFDALAINDIGVQLISTDQTTVLATANAFGAGVAENIPATNLPGAGAYFVRAFGGAVNNVQGYRLQVTISDGGNSISINDVTLAEGNASTSLATFTVSLASPAGTTIGVNWATADNTATSASGDYVANGGSLSFTVGQQTKQVSVTINGDLFFEPDETFFVNLSGASNAIITDSQGIGSITNDDTQNPIVTTTAAGVPTDSTVTLNASISPNGLATNAFFQYGLTTGYGSTTGTSGMAPGFSFAPVAIPVTGLACNTLHHFRAGATNAAGTTFGGDLTFTTAACPPPPIATTNAATSITQTGATLNGSVNTSGAATNRRFEYGTTMAYGFTSPDLAIGNSGTEIGRASCRERVSVLV